MRCAIYARYSTELQDEKSIEDQVRECWDFAEKKGRAIYILTQVCWYTVAPIRPNLLYLFGRMYFVLFGKGSFGIVMIPFAILYFLII